MYLGPITTRVPLHSTRYVVGLGDLPTTRGTQPLTLERYQCEQCGREAQVRGRATEPFYCRQCQALIGIEAAKETLHG